MLPGPEASPSPRRLHWYPHALAVVKLAPDAPLPDLTGVGLFSLTQTPQERSLVLPEAAIPASALAVSRGWRALAVEGPLDFSLVGVLASLSSTLAEAGVSLFAVSTYDTDLLLVAQTDAVRAHSALEAAGWVVANL